MNTLKLLIGIIVWGLGFCLGRIYRFRWLLLIAGLIYIVVKATN